METSNLPPTAPQEDALRAALAAALENLSETTGIRADVGDLRFATLATVSGEDLCGGGERIAGVLSRFVGQFDQVGLFAMETEEAFGLVRDDPGLGDLLGSYVALGRDLVRTIASAVDPESVRQEGSATLQEDSTISTLLRTHAPSTTAVLAVAVRLSWRNTEVLRNADVYLLCDPKPFAARLSELVPGDAAA